MQHNFIKTLKTPELWHVHLFYLSYVIMFALQIRSTQLFTEPLPQAGTVQSYL